MSELYISWVKIAILLGYLGVVICLINLGRKYIMNSYEKSKQKYNKETISNIKKGLLFIFLFAVVAGIFTYGGLWSIDAAPPFEYIHVLILTCAYIAISYLDFSLREKRVPASQKLPEKDLQKSKSKSQDIYLATVKKIWYINPVILLVYCIFYTQVNPYPFWGIWGILAWATSVLATYPVVPLLSYIFEELKVTEKKRGYIFLIIMSWIMAVFFLGVGK